MDRQHSIKAIFFLSIFSLLMLHSLVPHVHHSPEQHAEADHPGAHQHHGQDTHHHQHDSDDSSSGEDDGEGFLQHFLFGSHTHNVHAHEYSRVIPWEFQTAKETVVLPISQFEHGGLPPPFIQQHHKLLWHKDALFDDPLLCTRSLRAPPSFA